MKLLRNPLFAILISTLLVIGTLAYTTQNDMQKQCDKITDLFYNGVTYDGYAHPAAADTLSDICNFAEGLYSVTKASVDSSDDFNAAAEHLRESLSSGSVASIYKCYNAFTEEYNVYLSQLGQADLTDREEQAVTTYTGKMTGAISTLEQCGYNEAVRSFNSGMTKLQSLIVKIGSISLPELFE